MTETLVHREDGLVTITFNRPEKKNAINAVNWHDLERVLEEVAASPSDRAVVLTGADGNFSSGADLTSAVGADGSLSALTGQPRQGIVHEMRFVNTILNRLHRLPKPTIAAVDGVAVGVSVGIALACDLVIASARARFSTVFVKRGLSLDGGTSWSLPHHVGLRRAKQMAFFGEMVAAEDALAWGLINEVVAPDELAGAAREWGLRLAKGPTTTLGLVKGLLDAGSLLTFEQALEHEAQAQHIASTTEDMAEGIKAFQERRPPEFTGR